MNLADLTSYICTKGQMVGTADIAAAKKFISKRYELIYNSYLWKDSLAMVNVSVDPTNADNAEGIVFLPEDIERVVAVRTDDRSVRIHGIEDYYRVDFDRFNQTGTPYEFSLISPIWFVWRGYGGLKITSTAASDDGKIVRVKWFDKAGRAYTQDLTINSTNPPTLLSSIVDTYGIFVSGAGTTEDNGAYAKMATPITGGLPRTTAYQQVSDPDRYVFSSETLNDPPVTGLGWIFGNYSDTPVQTDYYTNGALTDAYSLLDGAAPAPAINIANKQTIVVERMFCPVLSGALTVSPIYDDGATAYTIPAGSTQSPTYQRLRLFSIPNLAITLRVLGKRKLAPLNFDQEEPLIKNLDNCLMAFALGDLWARRRQMGKANMCYQEGAMLLQELAKLETIQAANNSRFIPDGGMGDPFFGPGRSGGFWI